MTESAPERGSANETKLTRTKQRWAAEGRFLTGRVARPEVDRLPPGQHLVKDWPVLDLGMLPTIRLAHWRLTVGGVVGNPQTLDWSAFQALPHVAATSDIHCVTTWSRYDNHWGGVATRDLMALVEPQAGARFVELQSFDGYTTNLPIDDFAAEDAILAESWEGAPLTPEHGWPLRLVVPHLYFWKSAKWLKAILFRTEDQLGFWETRGYHERGDPWLEQRYAE